MIKKFIKIKGTGKFIDYQPATVPGPYRVGEFNKVNLIYGENGIGKTTIASIFTSLKGNDLLLKRRRSFGVSEQEQQVQVLTDLTPPNLSYSNSSWSGHHPDIEVFDVHFINDNIYTGLDINSTHKKNLFEVIFGSDGVRIKSQIQSIKEQIQEKNITVNYLKRALQSAAKNEFSVEEYQALEQDAEIDAKITAKEGQIITAQARAQIQAKQRLSEITNLSTPIELEQLERLLTKTLSGISGDYLRMFNEHKNGLPMVANAESWIQQGYSAIHDETCPFCARKFDDTTEIIEAYNQYFNEEYRILVSSIRSIMSSADSWNLEAELLRVQGRINSNTELIEFWKDHVSLESPTVIGIDQALSEIGDAFNAIKEAIRTKHSNPLSSVEITCITEFRDKLQVLNQLLSELNNSIQNFNVGIDEVKNSAPSDVGQLRLELGKLQIVKKRFDPENIENCTNYNAILVEVNHLDNQKTAKQTELDAYTNAIFNRYSDRINHYLCSFAPYLKLENFSSTYVGRSTSPEVRYALHVHNNEIVQGDDQERPCFKYSLSEGDKTALALAFFFAKLDLDGTVTNKTVVFDDPISSFDLNRKTATVSKLVEFSRNVNQLFVLTHNLYFAGEFWKAAPSTISSSYKIEYLGTSSCLVDYDIASDLVSGVVRDCRRMKTFLAVGSFTDNDRRAIARLIRPVLEGYFRAKFYDEVSDNQWLGDFLSRVRESTAGDVFHRLQPQLSELTEINDFSKKYHHSSNDRADSEPINDTELRTYCEKTLEMVHFI
jgi:wobble nucleotide-excising tRNase